MAVASEHYDRSLLVLGISTWRAVHCRQRELHTKASIISKVRYPCYEQLHKIHGSALNTKSWHAQQLEGLRHVADLSCC